LTWISAVLVESPRANDWTAQLKTPITPSIQRVGLLRGPALRFSDRIAGFAAV
jgi:hypothetical protein